MKLTVTAENLIERLLLAFGVAPVTILDAHMSFIRARTIMVGVKLGVFDVLASGASTAADVTDRCGASLAATEKLMNALVAPDICEEMGAWQRDAGLMPRKPIRLRTMPGTAEVVAVKPG